VNKENSINYVFENEALSFKSYITEFTDEIYNEFDLKSKEAGLLLKIDDLFSGKKINTTEGLAAWHTKIRAEHIEPFSKQKYIELFHSAINIVTIGIGGSFEGPKLLIEAEGNTEKNYIFITGSDSNEFKEKTEKLNPNETIFIVSSKSFTTEETITTLNDAIRWSQDMNKFLAITANKSEAQKYNIKNIIEFDKEIGGRYSIWSDISIAAHWENNHEYKNNFIMGGKQADKDLNKDQSYLKFVKTLAFSDIWLNNYKNKSSRAVLSYIWKFRSLPDYVQQLEMESLGKKPSKKSGFNKTGQIIFGGYGPKAQHSYFQLLHQGTQDVCADIIASKENTKSLAYAQAITQANLLSNGANDFLKEEEKINGNIPLNLFTLNKINAYNLGYLIATWEHRTFITAVMVGINPFDQFGVSAGKIYTKKYLKENGG
tara:strand:- start:3504 stop:4793 length:1290 start_codon:yes stop_codon:yes gene_type:complete